MLHRDMLVQTGVPSMHHTGTLEHINNLVPPCVLSEASPQVGQVRFIACKLCVHFIISVTDLQCYSAIQCCRQTVLLLRLKVKGAVLC